MAVQLSQEGYARLPEDLLRDLLYGADQVVDTVTALLSPALERRDELRAALADAGMVRAVQPANVLTVAGIDGGFAVERTAAVDLSLSVAVGVEGLSDNTTAWDAPQYEWWSLASKHDIDAERLARGVMVAEELAILAQAPHELRILDGSHLTLVIQLNAALTSLSNEIREEARRVWRRLDTISALAVGCGDRSIVAMPKYDSSRTVTEVLEKRTGEAIPGDDKHLMGLLLEPGEMLRAMRVPEDPWRALHFDARSKEDEPFATGFEKAIEPLRDRRIDFIYFKPDESSPAFRIELKTGLSEKETDSVCTTIASQITGPFVREPYPQYLADVMAKSVGLGLSALQSAVQLALSGLGKPEIAEYLLRSYRTEGV